MCETHWCNVTRSRRNPPQHVYCSIHLCSLFPRPCPVFHRLSPLPPHHHASPECAITLPLHIVLWQLFTSLLEDLLQSILGIISHPIVKGNPQLVGT